MNIPENLLYSSDHEWVRIEDNKAIIGITVLADKQVAADLTVGLNSASWYIRKELSARLSLKRTPVLEFVLDTKINQGDAVLELLDTIQSEHKESGEARN